MGWWKEELGCGEWWEWEECGEWGWEEELRCGEWWGWKEELGFSLSHEISLAII